MSTEEKQDLINTYQKEIEQRLLKLRRTQQHLEVQREKLSSSQGKVKERLDKAKQHLLQSYFKS